MKILQNLETEYSRLDGSNFWVAETAFNILDNGNGKGNGNGNGKVIVGCVGFRISKPSYQEKKDISSEHVEERIEDDIRGEVSHMCVEATSRQTGVASGLMDVLIGWASGGKASLDDGKVISKIKTSTNIMIKTSIDTETEIKREMRGTTSRTDGQRLRLRTLDLTVLIDLSAARVFYSQLGFMDQGPKVDLGHGCYMQHMSKVI